LVHKSAIDKELSCSSETWQKGMQPVGAVAGSTLQPSPFRNGAKILV